jgi:hypothetical protein
VRYPIVPPDGRACRRGGPETESRESRTTLGGAG